MSNLVTVTSEDFSVGFYEGSEPAGAPSLSYPALVSTGDTERATDGTEAANLSVTLDNLSDELAGIMSDLVGKPCVYSDAGATVLSGIVRSITISDQIQLQIVS